MKPRSLGVNPVNPVYPVEFKKFRFIGVKYKEGDIMQEALGVIETKGYTTAMEAADASVKAANIRFCDWLKVGGGKVNIIFRGDIAAVKAAVEAGVASASQIGEIQGQTIIPSPSTKLTPKFPIEAKK